MNYYSLKSTLNKLRLRHVMQIHIGKNTTINPHAVFMDKGMVSIGDNCSISGVVFVTHSGGDRVIKNRWDIDVDSAAGRRIVVGNNVTIGASVTVLYGVTIGDDCFIGAGSHITKDVPAGTVTRPPEASHVCTTDAYVQRLAARAPKRTRQLRVSPRRPNTRSHVFPLRVPAWMMRLGLAFGAGALLVPSPFY